MGIIRSVITGVVGVGIVSAGAWSLDHTTRDQNGSIVESGELGVFNLAVGDCVNDLPTGTSVDKGIGVPCTSPHQYEVFAETFLGDESTTVPKDMRHQAHVFCLDEFEKFVGITFDDSALEMEALFPSKASWEGGDKEITCLVAEASNAKATGTLAGANR
jgi:hypothetical protein